MNAIKKNIPNAITCGNLASGCVALVFIFRGDLKMAAYLVALSMVFDYFDGFVARLLHVSSPIGKELDSLADMVSFGLVPATIIYHLLEGSYWAWAGFLIAIFSALRLAKFNIDESQKKSFRGLPTPANALFICSLVFLPEAIEEQYLTEMVLVIIAILFSFLLIAPIRLFAFKVSSLAWRGNEIRAIFLLVCMVLIIFLKLSALPLIIPAYILLSILNNSISKKV